MDFTPQIILDLADEYGEAFYLLDSKQFNKNYIQLKKTFSEIYSNFNIAYSYKTNYIPKLCKIVSANGGYAEVVSDMEMEIALRVGVNPKKIIWNGPIKKSEKVEQLLLKGGTVNVDSMEEMQLIKKIAMKNPNIILNIGIRCNFDVGDGVISRFGFDTDTMEFEKMIDDIKLSNNIHVINLQCHFAKRNVEYWPVRAEKMLKLAEKIALIMGYMPERIDLGGGMYGNMDESLKKQFNCNIPTYKDYANAVAEQFAQHFPHEQVELIVEPGTALAGDCMSFVGKVESIKNIRGKWYATMLGSQKNINMGGIKPPMQVIALGKERITYDSIDVVGYTCIEADVLLRDYKGELGVGDYIVFNNCGSYSIVMKPPFILPNFPILEICDSKVEVIKQKETFEDVFRTYSF